MGWQGTKWRAISGIRDASPTTAPLTLETSMTNVSGPRKGAACLRTGEMEPEWEQSRMTSAPWTAFSKEGATGRILAALRREEARWFHPASFHPFCFLSARARDPPNKPTPMMATFDGVGI